MGRLCRFLGIVVPLVIAIPSVAGSQPEDVRFELHRGYLVVVKGSVDHLQGLSFVVDTGARRTVLDERIARKLHLQSLGTVEKVAPGHAVEMQHAIVDKISWGGGTLNRWDVSTCDLSSISTHLGMHIDLLLGLDVLSQSSFELDYKSRRIHFARQATPETSVPLQPSTLGLVIQSRVDGHPVNLLVDTGSDSLAIFTDRLPMRGPSTAAERSGHDVSGPVSFTRISPQQLLLGDDVLPGPGPEVFLLPPRPEAQGYDGYLAPTALGKSRIYFDFQGMRFGWDKAQ